MKRICLALALLAAGAAHAGQKVYDPASGVYVDVDTGDVSPRVAPNVALDPNTGQVYVVPQGASRRAPPQQAVPAGANCQWVRASVHDRHTLQCYR